MPEWQAQRASGGGNEPPKAGLSCWPLVGTRSFRCSTYTVDEPAPGSGETGTATWLSTDDLAVTRYALDWGDGTVEDPLPWWGDHQYAADGTYTVAMTVWDEDGATDSATFTIVVGEAAPGDPTPDDPNPDDPTPDDGEAAVLRARGGAEGLRGPDGARAIAASRRDGRSRRGVRGRAHGAKRGGLGSCRGRAGCPHRP